MVTDDGFDVILWGATGYTGRIAAQALLRTPGLRWALGGRSEARLRAVLREIGAPADASIVTADAHDAPSLRVLTERTRAVLTAVGPYRRHGSALVEACALSGTDYVDLSGEPEWMRQMIDRFEDDARRSGARITFACGFDSVPMELGVQLLQSAAVERWGTPLPKVSCRIEFRGGKGFSPGTLTSLRDSAEASQGQDPFILTPGFRGPEQPRVKRPSLDERLGVWIAPWAMGPVNTRVLHRSNALRGHSWGQNFVYDEALIAGPGLEGRKAARAIAVSLGVPASYDAVTAWQAPTPDSSTAYRLLFIGEDGDRRLCTTVTGTGDPGYEAAAAMAVAAACCLVADAPTASGGMWTPGALLGDALTHRLTQSAAMTFNVEDTAV